MGTTEGLVDGDCGGRQRFPPATTYLLISRGSWCIAHSIDIKLTTNRIAKHSTLLEHLRCSVMRMLNMCYPINTFCISEQLLPFRLRFFIGTTKMVILTDTKNISNYI